MNIVLHQTHQTIADFDEIKNYLKQQDFSEPESIHIFPENFLCGYPLQDLCLQKPFIDKYLKLQEELRDYFKDIAKSEKTLLLIGGLEYKVTSNGLPETIKNVVFQVGQNKNLEPIYTKQLLPNYDIFDEKKYFTKGKESKVINFNGKNLGILICEDMWASSFYDIDPVKNLADYTKNQNIQLDAIINLSASPYLIHKQDKRINRAKYISQVFKCPFYYVNKVGGEDEILFDGRSFVVDNDQVLTEGKLFETQRLNLEFLERSKKYLELSDTKKSYTWEDLFASEIETKTSPAKLREWDEETCEEVFEALKFGFQEYAKKSFFNNFTIALSGGMDSALVLTIMRLSLKEGQYLEAVYMPSQFSSTLSYDLSLDLAKNLGIPLTTLPIKFLHSTAKNQFKQSFPQKFEGLTDENIQSRMRGLLLYTRSNQINSMVVNTSNKSELAVGYSTQYGDSVGAISLLGDIYKSQVFKLAKFINQKYNNIIPEQIITRPPSAELREDQKDTDSLPPYERLDAILDCILNYRYTHADIVDMGFNSEEVTSVFNMYRKNEYKRYQFSPIVKINSKSFGFGYRIPLSKNSNFYL